MGKTNKYDHKEDQLVLDLSTKSREHIVPQIQKYLQANSSLVPAHKSLTVLTANQKEDFASIILDSNQQINRILPKSIQKIFSCCVFPSIKCIELDEMWLRNCEFLSFMQLPNLQFLSVQNNCISSFKPLQKGKFNFMNRLIIYENPVVIMDWGRIKLQKQIKSLLLEFTLKSPIICQNLAQLIKMEATYCEKLRFKSKTRIRQSAIKMKILREKVI